MIFFDVNLLFFLNVGHKIFGRCIYVCAPSDDVVVFLWARKSLNFDSGERDLGTVEVVGFLEWREIKAGGLKAGILELRSLPHGYWCGVR